MKQFKMVGNFNTGDWDDFISVDESLPNVSIWTGDKEDIDLSSDDDWIDVTVRKFTKENCLTALEAIANDSVQIIETGSCISV